MLETLPPPSLADDRYLGPARVEVPGDGTLEVSLGGQRRVSARLAMAIPYRAEVGDELLVIGDGESFYVVGVLAGNGRTALAVPGDVDVHAVGGTLRLSGDRGVTIEGNEVGINADLLTTTAHTVKQRFGSLWRHVRDLCTTRAGEQHAVVDGSSYSRTERTVILAEKTVTVNGKQIQLG